MNPLLAPAKPILRLLAHVFVPALAAGLAGLIPRIAHAEDPWAVPKACLEAEPRESSMGGSEMLDAAMQAKWDIEDDVGESERRASFSGGVVAGVGFQKASSEWTKKVVIGPAATFRVHWGATLPHYLVERSVQRIERLKDHTLPRLAKQSQQSADAAGEEKKRLENKRAELDKTLKSMAKSEPPTSGDSAAQGNEAGPTKASSLEFAAAVRREWKTQLEAASARLSDACADNRRVQVLRKELVALIESTKDKESAFGGFEGMLGYGFDLLSKPIDPDLEDAFKEGRKPMPGIIGGVGVNIPMKGLTLSLGFMMHQQGLLGVYTGIGVPIFN